MQPLDGTTMKATTCSEGGPQQVGLVDVVTSVTQFWSEWSLRISVLCSLSAYVLLFLLSGTRRRSASGRWSLMFRWAKVFILWAAYQVAEKAATSALDESQSLCDSDESAAEQQVITFWAPFLLLHLAGPDNLAAYSPEDNKLSLRKVLEITFQLLGVIFAIWNHIYLGGGGGRDDLFPAAVIMFVVGGARYAERACAQWRGNLDNMTEDEDEDSKSGEEVVTAGCTSSMSTDVDGEMDLDDGEALLLAQDLFPIWRRALIDSSVEPESPSQRSSDKIFSLGWRSMCKVVEMELSLMYEVLYTKATVAHTLPGYLIRLVSPMATATATSLFWHYRNKAEYRHVRESFVIITYLLLGAAIAMDVVWLLRALGSTWTYHLLKTKTRPWFRHKALCPCCGGWWRQLHRAVLYLDPLRLLGTDPVSCRRWSGTVGRYNLLHECTTTRRRRRPWRRWLATKLGLEETRYLSELPEAVKELVFQRVVRILPSAGADDDDRDRYTMAAITTLWGQEALRRGEGLFGGNKKDVPVSGREFEQDVLAWHIATCIFLSRAKVRKLAARSPATTKRRVAAIEAMSEYLMFLVAERRQMLPGIVLHRLLDRTRRALEEIWDEGKGTASTCAAGGGNKADKLATMLRQKRRNGGGGGGGRRLVLDAAAIAAALTKSSMRQGQQVEKMLELIFNVWVDKLLYAGVRCGEESHARQLSHGGELTTVLWIVVQHAGPFRIGEPKPDPKKSRPEEMPEMPTEENNPPPGDEPSMLLGPMWYPCPNPCYPCPCHQDEPWIPMAKPSPEDEDEATKDYEMAPITEDEEDDPEDAEDCKMPIEYATLY